MILFVCSSWGLLFVFSVNYQLWNNHQEYFLINTQSDLWSSQFIAYDLEIFHCGGSQELLKH